MSDAPSTSTTDVLIPGARDVRGSLDGPDDGDRLVVACPPHPQHGGSRTDTRLRAASTALADRGVSCVRIDYGPWDEGYGEREDVRNALRWAHERAATVACFGFSFGASEAILASASVDVPVDRVSALAPAARLAPDLDVPDAVTSLGDVPLQVVYGTRDDTADWEPVRDAAADRGAAVIEWSADHFFVGQEEAVATEVADFLTGV
ncbi:alpha/beta hydrolase [Halovivax cerinus]|uniref:Alpha/beta hydrolase n=1 Tax=Halovivax cerinus TaxID=1487865 RepID=A0ABD5NIN8_9EURY|nr:alpha/beta hydrolase [Halovivax cerinus]